MNNQSVIVIGGGIAGLTASALLAYEGIEVTLLESHHQLGGCAGTFKRGTFVFDVGATQVAGLEVGGSHERIFRHLELPPLSAEILDPACSVDLGDGSPTIHIWHDPKRWEEERKRQFPKSELFWSTCHALHQSNWALMGRDPILPVRNLWDLCQLTNALRLANIPIGLLSTLSVTDLLRLCRCSKDQRLKQFLDLQLRLYSQEFADCTSALYGATVLQMAQAPLGLWHLKKSMQQLSDHLASAISRDGGKIFVCHRVVRLEAPGKDESWKVDVVGPKGKSYRLHARDVICSLPPQSLTGLMPIGSGLPDFYRRRIEQLPKPTGALVFYGALNRKDLPENCSSHFQICTKESDSLFISISREGDGRAPIGQATLIASMFTETSFWLSLNESDYQKRKQTVLMSLVRNLEIWLGHAPQRWLHQELSTPRSFAKWTGRPNGIVGGLGQRPFNSGLFGFSSRTPMRGLWLCGDSIHPGEGTAGVTQSALMVCRQLMAQRSRHINLAS